MVDYVKYCREAADDTFYDPLKESWNMVGDHIEKLEAALRLIAQNNYGLQGMMEDGTDTPEAKAEYYAGQVARRQHIARKALEGNDE